MEVILHIKPEIGAVLLINGSFVERADNVRCELSSPLYLTVLPLEAIYLPYTVKLVSAKPITNTELCSAYALNNNRVLVRLKPRFNYVYSPSSAQGDRAEIGVVPKFFRYVKEGAFTFARECMTKELSATVTDDDLKGFFEDYVDIAENTYTSEGGWFLLKEGEGTHFVITQRSGLIDNMEEA